MPAESYILINNDEASTDDNDVILTIRKSDALGNHPETMRLTEDPSSWGAWEPYAETRAWKFSPQTSYPTQPKTVYVDFTQNHLPTGAIAITFGLGIATAGHIEIIGSPTYGCTKPTIPDQAASHVGSLYSNGYLANHAVRGGAHDVTYSYVRFTGHGTTSSGGATAAMVVNSSYKGDITNIVFDHCVFATCDLTSAPSNAFHCWNITSAGGPWGVISDILFRDCWFEPASRLGMEVNGRGGWLHDWRLENCTFEACNGELLSFDMASGNWSPQDDPAEPNVYGIIMPGGIVRGWEGISVKNSLFEGTGPSAGVTNGGVTFYDALIGYPASYRKGHEFGCVYPYVSDNAVGRSEFIGNKTGKCYSSWYQTNYSGASYMTFRDNVWDATYDDHDCAGNATRLFDGVSASHCTFDGNTYILHDHTLSSVYGNYTELNSTHNTMTGEHWSKPVGALSSAAFPYGTGSVYTGNNYNLPRAIAFSTQATGSGNTFNAYGYTGGDGSM